MPTKTVTEISLISNITGVVKIKNADGTFRELHAGDTIQPGAVLVFDDGAQLTLKDVNTSQTQVIVADQLPHDPSVAAVTPPENDVDIAQYQKGRFSLYVLVNTLIPPDNHDFVSSRRCSFTLNQAK